MNVGSYRITTASPLAGETDAIYPMNIACLISSPQIIYVHIHWSEMEYPMKYPLH
jgi:hypothetical protein